MSGLKASRSVESSLVVAYHFEMTKMAIEHYHDQAPMLSGYVQESFQAEMIFEPGAGPRLYYCYSSSDSTAEQARHLG